VRKIRTGKVQGNTSYELRGCSRRNGGKRIVRSFEAVSLFMVDQLFAKQWHAEPAGQTWAVAVPLSSLHMQLETLPRESYHVCRKDISAYKV